MNFDYYGFKYNFTYLELSLIGFLFLICLVLLFKRIFKKKEIRYLTTNFLDDLPSENEIKVLTEAILKKIIKKYKFTSYAYMFINGVEVDFVCHLTEKVPDLYVEDVKKKIYDAVIESGIDPSVENKKVNPTILGLNPDPKARKVLADNFQVPIIVNDVLIGMFCFGSSDSIVEEEGNSILDIYEGVNRKYSDLSKFLESVKEGKDKFEDLINSMRNPVAMLGKNFDLIYINPAFEDLLKLSSEKDFNILDFSRNMPRNLDIEKTLQDIFVKVEPRYFKNINFRGFIYDVSFFPVIKNGKSEAVSILFQEVTSEYQNEKIKQEFTAMLIHELRAPLTVIKSSSDLLIKRFDDLEKKKVKDILKGMLDSSNGMLDLVSDLLDTSKLEMNKLQIMKRVNNLNSFVEEKVSFFENEMLAKKLKLVISLDNKIKDYSFDENKLTQVINNLMSNAIKYTDKGSIKVSTKVSKEFITIDFEDTGLGIPDEQKSKLFNKFVQLETSVKNKSKGTGLGLVVSQGIISAHGGTLKVLDNKPHGTIFRIELPNK